MHTTEFDAIDMSKGLPVDVPGDTPEGNVWRLLCSCTLSEVEPMLRGLHADDIATRLSLQSGYRALKPEAAAYLWLSVTPQTLWLSVTPQTSSPEAAVNTP